MHAHIQRYGSLFVWILISLLASASGAFTNVKGWYEALHKPIWTPPNVVFGPVWTLLYILIGVAAWQIWAVRRERSITLPLTLFGIQWTLNAAWTLLFFGLHRPDLAFVDIAALWITLLLTVIVFWRYRVSAGLLLLPYLFWVGFACALNFAIWQMNR